MCGAVIAVDGNAVEMVAVGKWAGLAAGVARVPLGVIVALWAVSHQAASVVARVRIALIIDRVSHGGDRPNARLVAGKEVELEPVRNHADLRLVGPAMGEDHLQLAAL